MLFLFILWEICFTAAVQQKPVHALVVIDVQNCFLPGGELQVANGDKIIPKINQLRESGIFQHVVFTQDWHPEDHISFATNAGAPEGSLLKLFYDDSGKLCQRTTNFPFDARYNPVDCPTPPPREVNQMMWPAHCVENTPSADFGPNLDYQKRTDLKDNVIFFKKGNKNYIDSYSAFFDNDKVTKTGLDEILRKLKVTHTYFVGLAMDYCVQESAHDSKKVGFETTVIADACEGLDQERIRETILPGLTGDGIYLRTAQQVINALKAGNAISEKDSTKSDAPSLIQIGPAGGSVEGSPSAMSVPATLKRQAVSPPPHVLLTKSGKNAGSTNANKAYTNAEIPKTEQKGVAVSNSQLNSNPLVIVSLIFSFLAYLLYGRRNLNEIDNKLLAMEDEI